MALGCLVQGVTGLGMALVAVPLLFYVLPAEAVPPTSVLICTLLNLTFFCRLRANVAWKLLLPLLIGAAAGVLPGVLLLKWVPASSFKAAAGVTIAALGCLLGFGVHCPVESPWLRGAVGFVAGVLNGALSTSGPMVAAFLSAGNVRKDVFRASMAAFFLLTNVATAAVMGWQGLLTRTVLFAAAAAAPVVLAAAFAGLWLAKRVPEGSFRKYVIAVVVFSGLSLIF